MLAPNALPGVASRLYFTGVVVFFPFGLLWFWPLYDGQFVVKDLPVLRLDQRSIEFLQRMI